MSFTLRLKALFNASAPLPKSVSRNSRLPATGHRSAPATHRDIAATKKALGAALQDTMLPAGLLSAEYSFKVLTTVGDKAKHILVVNLTRNLSGGQEQLAAAERLVALLARARHDMEVSAIYWRVASLVGRTQQGVLPTLSEATADIRGPANTRPAPLPLTQRVPKFYDDEPGYKGKASEFPDTRAKPADSDLMGLFP